MSLIDGRREDVTTRRIVSLVHSKHFFNRLFVAMLECGSGVRGVGFLVGRSGRSRKTR